MKWMVIFLFFIILSIVLIVLSNKNRQQNIKSSKKINMINVTSAAFKNGGTLPKKYTCDGQGINPPLTIDDAPTNSKSLVLIVDDPDAPMGTFNHWLVWNINPQTKEILENNLPRGGIVGVNDFGKNNFGPPCPPFGTHRYYFRIYALDIEINLEKTAKRGQLEDAIKNHVLNSGELIGRYSR